jgi:hypothetical protein
MIPQGAKSAYILFGVDIRPKLVEEGYKAKDIMVESYAYTHAHSHIDSLSHIHTHTLTHIYTHTCTHTHTHTHTHTYTHVHTLIYMHVHTQFTYTYSSH